MPGNQGHSDHVGRTRRTKRKADEEGKPPSGKTKRRTAPKRAASSPKDATRLASSRPAGTVTTPSAATSTPTPKKIPVARPTRSARSYADSSSQRGTGGSSRTAAPTNVGNDCGPAAPATQPSRSNTVNGQQTMVNETRAEKINMLLQNPGLLSLLEAHLPTTSAQPSVLPVDGSANLQDNLADHNPVSLNEAGFNDSVVPNRRSNAVNDSDLSDDKEDELPYEDNDDEDEEHEDASDANTDRGQIGAPNLGESEDEREVSFTEQVGNEPYNPAANARRMHRDLTDPIDEDRPSGPSIDVGELHTHGTSTARHWAVNSRENAAVLNISGVDESAVLTIVQGLKTFISKEMNMSFNKLSEEVRSDREELHKLREDVTQATSIMTTTACSLFIKNPATTPRGKEIQRKICLLPAIFNDNIMLMIVPRVVTGFFATSVLCGSSYTTISSTAIQFYSVLNFSLQPHDRKNLKFSSEVGKMYSKFRYSLLMSSLLALQRNTFNNFSNTLTDSLVDDSESKGEGDDSQGYQRHAMQQQPFWLKHGYIVSEHCVTAGFKMEGGASTDSDETQDNGDATQTTRDNESCDNMDQAPSNDNSQSSTKQKSNRSGPLTRNEIATEASCMLYRIITGVLSRSRNASKLQLFHDLTYLFVGWKHHGSQIDQKSLKMKWEAPLTGDIKYIDGLARTKTVRPSEQRSIKRRILDQIDLDNITLLETLIAEHPELSVLVEHDVLVNGVVTQLRFRVNLIEVACRYLASYITLESAAKSKDALRADQNSLKVIIVLAIGLRIMLDKAIRDLSTQGSAPWINNTGVMVTRGRPRRRSTNNSNSTTQLAQYAFESIDTISIDRLQPSPSKQKDALNQMILKLTEQEFASKMVTLNGSSLKTIGSTEAAGTDSSDQAPIEADEIQGVFAL